jgi:hypothetical protein
MFSEPMQLKGTLELTLFKSNREIETRRKDNIIVNVGYDFIANAIGKPSSRPSVMSHIGVGTGATAPAAGNTALLAQLNRQPVVYTHAVGTKTFSFSADFAAGIATGALTEAGVFNAASSGIMFDRVVFSVINKGADDTLSATFTFTMS